MFCQPAGHLSTTPHITNSPSACSCTGPAQTSQMSKKKSSFSSAGLWIDRWVTINAQTVHSSSLIVNFGSVKTPGLFAEKQYSGQMLVSSLRLHTVLFQRKGIYCNKKEWEEGKHLLINLILTISQSICQLVYLLSPRPSTVALLRSCQRVSNVSLATFRDRFSKNKHSFTEYYTQCLS